MTRELKHEPLMLGIGGPSGSGKTTLAKALVEHLGDQAVLITHDRYYRDVPDPSGFNYDEPAAFDTALLEQHLDQLRAGEAVGLPIYEYATHRRQTAVDWVRPCPVVLLEGILVLSDPRLRALMDLQIFVDTALDICLIRRIRRDALHRGRDVASVLAQYERDVRPAYFQHILPAKEHADLVIDGAQALDQLVAQVLQAMERLR
ncbi:MAG: uridine kinase [Alphaproteobacteria bacterium]|nr:uridine kinase [Alphaproteobacteria bacterium]